MRTVKQISDITGISVRTLHYYDEIGNFEVFSQAEIEGMYHSMVSGMNEEQKKILAENYGSMEGFQAHFIENASREETQKNWRKVVEWYGDKESALEAAMNPVGEEVIRAYQKRLEVIMQKLVERKNQGYPVDSFEVKEVIGEYGFVQKQLFRIKHEKDIMLQMADIYEKNEQVRKECEMQFGTGVADFFADAIRAFYEE